MDLENQVLSAVFQKDIFPLYEKFPENDKHRLLYMAVQEILNHNFYDEKSLKLSKLSLLVLQNLPFRNDELEKYIFYKHFITKCKFFYYEYLIKDENVKLCNQCAISKNCNNLYEIYKDVSNKEVIMSKEWYCEICKNRLFVFEH